MLNVVFLSLNQGLKKLGQSIESSYSSIQKLVISHLQRYEDDGESFGVASARTHSIGFLSSAFFSLSGILC